MYAVNIPVKFEVRSFARSWDNRGTRKKLGPSLDTPTLPILFMAARQLAGRWPLYFTADISILLLFFRRLISEVSGPIVTKLRHMFGGDCNF